LVSCGNDDALPLVSENNQASVAEAEALYQKAKSADDAGKVSSAIKRYGKVADQFPSAPSAALARFRQAQLLEQDGKSLEAFDAYQKFLTRYHGSSLYSKALAREVSMAQAAAEGEIKTSFLGLKSKLATEKIVEMLAAERDNAPRSELSAKAQYTIGELYHAKKKSKEAIEAFKKLVSDQPESKLAPDALFQVGVILMEEADRGNRNQATLELAGEAFNDYLVQYPNHHDNAEARRMIKTLGQRQIDRELEIAEYYERSGKFESAKIYYREVLKNSDSGAAYDEARARLKILGE
jgi:outer membrane assembly lipoprotein YfiO